MKAALDDPVEHWQRVAMLLEAVLERGPAERARYLDETCRAQPALKAEVEALLARALRPSFLDSGALVFAAPLLEADGAVAQDALQLPEPLREFVRRMTRDATVTSPSPDGADEDGGSTYVLERKLGRGGMATVYIARDAKHDRRVAVKVLDAELTEHVGAERFAQEIRLTARLQHPHVLALLDSGVFESGALAGRPYYVMPYVAGESLRARLARGPLGVGEAVRVLREVADALSYAHEQGVIHRDIKPENILLSRGHAVVADFGIAKALVASQSEAPGGVPSSVSGGDGTATQFSSRVGTPAYMAPEQAAAGMLVDHRADLYAWGVVAYELLACRHPFERKTSAHELITAHTREVPPPLRYIAPTVPAGVAALVMQCLAKLPAERPGAALEILTALEASATATSSKVFASSRQRLGAVIALGMLFLASVLGGANAYLSKQPILVIATGDAVHDVRAIQAAVDRGGEVTLQGHFSFAIPPTKPIATLLASAEYPGGAEILISKAVNISGVRDGRGEMATIESGTIPFYVDAPGEHVTIRGLRFVRPTHTAILVRAVRGLEISSSKIEGLVPFSNGSGGISINTRGKVPLPSSPGNPENVSGQLLIASNEIDGTGGTARAPTAGLTVFSVGQSPDREVDLLIIDNHVSNTTAPAINIRRVHGRVRVLGNTVQTSPETVEDVDAVRLVNGGSILMANNTVECKWPNAAGIQVFSPFPEWPAEQVRVEDNHVLMSPSPGTALGDFSAGISIRGFAQGNLIRHNSISGRARAALSMYVFRGGVPADNAFIDNRLEGFEATVADIFVGSGVARGHIVGPGSLSDHGTATIRERRPRVSNLTSQRGAARADDRRTDDSEAAITATVLGRRP
jgi:serine/threonine protein kinase